jgi:prepilin peptidase CpaA
MSPEIEENRSHLMGHVSIIPLVFVLSAAIIAAVTNIWKFKVYNVLTIPLLGSGLLYHAATGGLMGLYESLSGCVLGFAILITFYIMGGVGAGDVKLLSAVGAWLGLPLTFNVFIASSISAGLYAIVVMIVYGSAKETLMNTAILYHRMTSLGRHLRSDDRVETQVGRSDRHRRLIPFAAMITAGLLINVALLWQKDGGQWDSSTHSFAHGGSTVAKGPIR